MDAREATEPAGDEPTEVLEPDQAKEWPVAELYRLSPENDGSPEDDGTVVVAEPAAVSRPSRRRIPGGGAGLAGAIVLVTLGIALGAWLLTRDSEEADARTATAAPAETSPAAASSTQPTTTDAVEVPSVVGLRLSNARALLHGAGFETRVTRRSSEDMPGEVLEQTPAAGRTLEPGGTVRLVVARAQMPAAVRVDVPDVVSLPAEEAGTALRRADLRPRIRLVPSTEDPGTVVEQNPPAGTEVRRGSLVAIAVARASAPEAGRVEVPDVVGSTASEARRALRARGFRVSVTRVLAAAPGGTVVGQTPVAGTSAREGATVRLRVSTGPTSATVPDVLGLDEATARAELEAAGFVVRVSEEPTDDPASDGVVLRQSPAGGASGEEGQVVTIVLGLYG